MNNSKAKIWIDLDNTPHVPFFKPIIAELEKRGHDIYLTARDCFQVCDLADLNNLHYQRIGRHYGKNKVMKGVGLVMRATQMVPMIIKQKPNLALSHGSRSQVILAKFLKIPSMVIFDYEHAKWLPFALPDCLVAPEVIPDSAFPSSVERIGRYPGIKEDVYVPAFQQKPGILGELGVHESELIVTIRPPATEAHYFNQNSELLFEAVVARLATVTDARMIMLPRNDNQSRFIQKMWPDLIAHRKIIIPDKIIDGLNLIWYSDLVISGGGTMNREAAALGVPVYSIFRGELGAIDNYLARTGRLTLIEDTKDVWETIRLSKRNIPANNVQFGKPALHRIVEEVEALLEKG